MKKIVLSFRNYVTKFLFLIFCILYSVAAIAQKEFNIWCFGQTAGLDFNSGFPVSFDGVMMSSGEGISAIADTNGKLLFYTDGVSVWNSHHIVMPHGIMLGGGNSSTQSALILKKPGSATLYSIFTTAEAMGSGGFCYSVVDMSLYDGLGDVTVKNVQLFTPCAEKLCATLHSNGTDIWVSGHEAGNNNFHTYLFSENGLDTIPVISSAGAVHPASGNGVVGYMKFSHNGKRIALAIHNQNIFELFDFNSSTGVVSNPVTIPANGNCYGVEFSPDDTKLYTTDDELDQYDLNRADASAIIATKKKISNDAWALQLGPDQKIYCATFSTPFLNVINSPNLQGADCNYTTNAVSLGNGLSRLGLPNYISNLFISVLPPESTTECLIQNLKLYPNPVTDKLTVSFPTQFWSDDVTITDITGREVNKKVIYESENTHSVVTTELSNGIYIFQFNMCSQTVIRKFVVLHQ